jgi:hypothetical protein
MPEDEKPFDPDTLKDLIGRQNDDQFATFITSKAVEVALYLSALRQAGIREGIAEQLTLDWAWLCWARLWWPDGGAPGR